MAENLQYITLYRSLAGVFFNFVLNLFLLPRYGAAGAALATVVSLAIVAFALDIFQAKTRAVFFLRLSSLSPSLLVGLVKKIH